MYIMFVQLYGQNNLLMNLAELHEFTSGEFIFRFQMRIDVVGGLRTMQRPR